MRARGIDILQLYLHTRNEVSVSRHSKVRAQTDRLKRWHKWLKKLARHICRWY